jgi:predicted nucleic acid-binding Zn ribbon protein
MKPIQSVLAGKAVSKRLWMSARAEHALNAWDELVGELVAQHSQPVDFRTHGGRGVLWLAVSDSSWSQELSLFRAELIRRLNEKAGMELFDDIRIRVQKVEPRRKKGSAAKSERKQPRERRVVQDIQQHVKWRLENWPEAE